MRPVDTRIARGENSIGKIVKSDPQGGEVSSPGCTVSVADAPLDVSPGRAWATFSCAALLDASGSALKFCTAEGNFVIEQWMR